MSKLIDGIEREIEFEKIPERIVSMVPCITETLFELGAEGRIAGITDYCIHPRDNVKDVQKIGGPKSIDKKLLDNLNPDLIFMDTEENVLEDFEELKRKYSIYVVKVKNLEDSVSFIHAVGEILRSPDIAGKITREIREILQELEIKYKDSPEKSVLILLWKDPYFVPGGDTYINSIVETCGLRNVFGSNLGYYEVDENQIIESSPDIILLPDEPYDFKEDDESELKDLFKNRETLPKIKMISGADLCWYGFRTLKGLRYMDGVVSEV